MIDNIESLCVFQYSFPGSLGGGRIIAFYKENGSIVQKEYNFERIEKTCEIFPLIRSSIVKIKGEEYLEPSLTWKKTQIL